MAFSVAKNTAFMTIASLGQKVVSFVYFTIVVNSIGKVDAGKYFVALSFTTLFSILVDVGMSPVLTREVAKDKDHAQRYLSTVLSAKLLTGIIAYATLVVVLYMLGYSAEMKQLVVVSGIVMLLDSIHLSYYTIFRAFQDVRWEAFGMFGSQLLTMLIGILALRAGFPLVYLMWAFVISSLCNLTYVAIMLYRKQGISFRFRADGTMLRTILRMAAPFALAGIFTRLYSSLDALMLKSMAGEAEAGLYSVPYKIAFAFQFIPMALIASLYPKISEYYAHERHRLQGVFTLAMRYLFLIAAPITIGGVLIGKEMLTQFYPKFIDALPAFYAMMPSIIFSFLSFPVGSMLNGCNRQSTQTKIMGLVVVSNVILNTMLIPLYGATGAAIAATASYAILFFGGLFSIRDLVALLPPGTALTGARIIGAVAVMAIAVLLLRDTVPLWGTVIGGGVMYILGSLLFGTITIAECKVLLSRKPA